MLTEYYFAVRYGDIIILLYHEDMMSVWELLFKNSQKEKALKRFLEYCYMIDVKVAFEGLKGEKTKGLKATLKFAKEHDMCMTEAQIQGADDYVLPKSWEYWCLTLFCLLYTSDAADEL